MAMPMKCEHYQNISLNLN